MRFFIKKVFVLSLCAVVFTACNVGRESKALKLGDKHGILLVTFGSSYEAPQKTFKRIDKEAKAEFSGVDVRWGYTSTFILKKLKQGKGQGALNGVVIDNDTPEEALEAMLKEGFSKFSILSFLVIPGDEFDELSEAIETFKIKYKGVQVALGRPLLDTDEDIAVVANIMADKFKTQIEEGPVIFMGHGTAHAADVQYVKLEKELQKINPHFFVGTVEGRAFDAGQTSIGGIISKINVLSPKPSKVTISPLMCIAGNHANKDMNGITGASNPAEQSWRERLEAEGYEVTDVMKGLGDYSEVNAIWMQHLRDVKMNELNERNVEL